MWPPSLHLRLLWENEYNCFCKALSALKKVFILLRILKDGWPGDLSKVVEAVYEKGVLRLLERLDLPEGARVRVRVEGFYGILREWKVDAQKLKDELRSMHS